MAFPKRWWCSTSCSHSSGFLEYHVPVDAYVQGVCASSPRSSCSVSARSLTRLHNGAADNEWPTLHAAGARREHPHSHAGSRGSTLWLVRLVFAFPPRSRLIHTSRLAAPDSCWDDPESRYYLRDGMLLVGLLWLDFLWMTLSVLRFRSTSPSQLSFSRSYASFFGHVVRIVARHWHRAVRRTALRDNADA